MLNKPKFVCKLRNDEDLYVPFARINFIERPSLVAYLPRLSVLPGKKIENILLDIQYFHLSVSRLFTLSGLKLFIYVFHNYLTVIDVILYFAVIN